MPVTEEGKNTRKNDQRILERINRWNSGDFGGLWNEAWSLKQSKRSNDTNSEEIIKRAKIVFSGPTWQSSKSFGFYGFAPVNKATLDSLKKLHPPEEKSIVVQNFLSQAYQFSEENVLEQLN